MQMPPTQYDVFPLAGGLDQITPTMMLKAGMCRRAVNFECSLTGGYTRIAGYTKYDGSTEPLAPAGTGNVLGGFWLGDSNYCFREDDGVVVLYKATTSGWEVVPFGEEIAFTNASATVADGETLTKGSVTAEIERVIVESGVLGTNPNSGRLILSGRAGGNFVSGAATTTSGTLTLGGAESAITLAPGGRFDCARGNFGGSAATQAIYGVDGVNRPWEFDGRNLVPINTGMGSDAPSLVAVHKGYLFLVYGSSLQFSSLGDPFQWSPVTGAGEIAMGSDITAIKALPGDQTSGALAVFTDSETSILYGSDDQSFQLTTFNSGSGAQPRTVANLEQSYLLNSFGVLALNASQSFGNFETATLTANIAPYVRERIGLGAVAAVSRSKSQYRLFFADGSGLYITLNGGQFMGAMPVEFAHPVYSAWEGQDEYGRPTTFFGTTEAGGGWVFEMDSGTSFGGEPISSTLELVFNGSGNHRVLKRYRKVSMELQATTSLSFSLGYALAFNRPDVPQGEGQTYSQSLAAVYWDAFTWDAFTWDLSGTVPAEVDLTGTAENISLRVSGYSATTEPYTISTVTLHYTPRRGVR